MGLFGPSRIVSHREFKKALGELSTKKLSRLERQEVANIFRGDLDESGSARGIDTRELEKTIAYMRANPHKHRIPSHKIDIIEETLKKKL